MENREERLDDLIQSKSFDDLTTSERYFVLAQMAEEEYTALRSVTLKLNESIAKSSITPRSETLQSLQMKLKEVNKQKSVWSLVLQFKVPAYATVLLMICAMGIGIFSASRNVTNKVAAITPAPVVKIDTVYITKTDTVVKEKTIYRYASVSTPQITKGIQAAKADEEPIVIPTGVSMKEKEDLNNLLVSGSD